MFSVLYFNAIATSLMYIGLNLTFASSFQMFRGAVIIFVALLSVAFLNRRLVAREWTGIFIIVLGLAMVGAADMLVSSDNSKHSRNDIITGDLLILAAQIITAVQMVYEEKFVTGIDIPALQGKFNVFSFAKSFQVLETDLLFLFFLQLLDMKVYLVSVHLVCC